MLETKLRKKYQNKLSLQLMIRRRWAYLRYLHLRQGFLQTTGVKSFLSVGCGTGLAEVALSLEFPEVHFHLTDIDVEDGLKSRLGMRMVKEWSIPNVTCGSYDILNQTQADYDFVGSVEVLEHIENDSLAVTNMKKAAKEYIFVLVPFATAKMNTDSTMLERVWKNQQHYRVGYDSEKLKSFFSNIIMLRGCYWENSGSKLREQLENLSNEEIASSLVELTEFAKNDIHDLLPSNKNECYGIWVLAKA